MEVPGGWRYRSVKGCRSLYACRNKEKIKWFLLNYGISFSQTSGIFLTEYCSEAVHGIIHILL